MIVRKYVAVLWLAVFLLLVAGCANGNTATTADAPQSSSIKADQPQEKLSQSQKVTNSADKMRLTLYFPTKDAMHLQPEEVVMSYNDHPARTAVELLIKGPKNKELVNVFPQGTILRGITVKNSIAYVDFDHNLLKNSQGGSSAESLLVASIVNTLTEFENIEKVQILIQGKVVGTIWGHMDVSEPLSRSEKIIKR